ncbi:MAG: AAA family ATPase [Myxococcota bacterium]
MHATPPTPQGPSARTNGAVPTDMADAPPDLTERVRALRDALLTGLVERDVAIRLALLAALSGEHLLLVGPPGTAKSMVARRLHLAFRASTYFERLLTRFTVPEELFGPLSIKGLEEDRYVRLTDAYLPTASIAFLDEIFKANSAILNALLTLLNEREFDNGTQRTTTPLLSVVGASNELPEEEELSALFDRFLLRLHVGPVSKDAFRALLALRGTGAPNVPDALRLMSEELLAVQRSAEAVEVPDDVVALLVELRDWCTAEGIAVSDRRWRKVVKLLQVSAVTNGRQRVSVWDAWLLQHCLWDTPEDSEKVYAWYAKRVGASAALDPARLTKIVVSWEARLKGDQDARSQARDKQGRLLFVGADGKETVDEATEVWLHSGKQPLYLAPANAATDYYCKTRLPDRHNGGKGFTEADLQRFFVAPGVQFSQWPFRDAYLTTAANRMVQQRPLAAVMEPTRHKDVYIDACLAQIDELKAEILTYRARLQEHMATLQREIRDHLWVTPDFADPAATALTHTAAEVERLLARVDRARQGFVMLPRESEAHTR